MNSPAPTDPPPDPIAQAAAAWVLRHDRGLSAAEQDEFFAWLAADPRHGAQLARHRRHWQRLDRLAQWRPEHGARPNPDLLAPPPATWVRRAAPGALALAAAAGLALLWFGLRPAATSRRAPPVAATASAAAPGSPAVPGSRILPDGTQVELNLGAELSVAFTAAERRVRLERGEAHCAVRKDPARPFIVSAAGVEVRAVGTAFNVRLDTGAVEVLVTEGRVQLDGATADAGAAESAAPTPGPILEARQRGVVSLAAAAPAPQVATLTAGEIARVLAWRHRLLDFTAAPLRDIVAEFNRRNVVQLVVMDPGLAEVRISAAFRSDNLAGFVALLEAGFGARAERRGDTEIRLHAGPAAGAPR